MNKFSYGFIFFVCLFHTSCAFLWKWHSPKRVSEEYVSPTKYNQWRLVWSDEFEGSIIDTSKWTHEVNDWGGGNEELQYYTDRKENSFVENGTLVIVAKREKYQTKHYTSARLNTKHKGDWKYGRFDIRARLPKGYGLWPAIWMLPSDNRYGPWPKGGEIDIAEVLGREPNQLHGCVHFGHESPQGRPSNVGTLRLPQGDFSDQFHVFSVEWSATEIRWYLDNVLYHSAPVIRPMDEPYHLLLNLAVGSKWPGNPKGNGTFPSYMYVDYVRVFERDYREISTSNKPIQSID